MILMLSDFDPDGEEIARSMRDDFGIQKIHPIKVALTADQVEQYHLPPVMQAKTTSSNYRKFTDKYGETVPELEALEPDLMQNLLREAIDSVIDTVAFNGELSAEKSDAVFLQGVRERVRGTLLDMEVG